MHRLRLAGCFLCCVVHVYGGHLRCKKNYPTTGEGQEEIGWNPSHVETVCDEHSQLGTEGWTSSVCLVNILTATNRTLQCASFFQILSCVCSEDMWVISKVLHNVLFLFKNEFILQSTFTGLNVISTVLYHSGPTFGQVLYSCQDAFVVDASDYSGHLLNASEAFPMEWFLQFWEQVKGWWAHVRTVRRGGKHLPTIIFQNFRYCTWGIRLRVNVWSLATARDLTPISSSRRKGTT